ncbi:hypothetical protein CPAV1605_871 [seawater metagenome]|uniref:Uncharacterized protein n=1 Tax=seawater metagenome TaxID=1561972 RepID=A0A5E8CJ31_9ZZZZ
MININLIFNPEVKAVSVMDIETNINKFPDKNKIICSLIKNFKNNKIDKKYFQNNFNLICKYPFLNNLNQDIVRLIKDYFFEYNNKQIKYILHTIYQDFDTKLYKLETDNNFDLG